MMKLKVIFLVVLFGFSFDSMAGITAVDETGNNFNLELTQDQAASFSFRIETDQAGEEITTERIYGSGLTITNSCIQTFVLAEDTCQSTLAIASNAQGIKRVEFRTATGQRLRISLKITRVTGEVPTDNYASFLSSNLSGLVEYGLVDGSISKNFYITNTGSSETETLAQVFFTSPGYSVSSDTCSGRVLIPGDNCRVRVSFDSAGLVGGTYTDQLKIHSTTSDTNPLAINLTADVQDPPQAKVNIDAGFTKVDSTACLASGPIDPSLCYFQADLPTSGEVSVGSVFCDTSDNCSVTMNYKVANEPVEFFISILFDDQDVSNEIGVDETGYSILLTAQSTALGDIPVGTTATQTVVATNNGTNPMPLPVQFSTQGIATISNNLCEQLVAPLGVGESCSMSVSITPVVFGSGSETIDVTTVVPTVSASTVITYSSGPIVTPPQVTYTLTLTLDGLGTGEITNDIDAQKCDQFGGCTFTFDENEVVQLTALADSGALFDTYTGEGCSTSSACSITMDSNKSITVRFNNHSTTTPLMGGFASGIWRTKQSKIVGNANHVAYFQNIITTDDSYEIGAELWVLDRSQPENHVVSSNVYDYLCSATNPSNPCVVGDLRPGNEFTGTYNIPIDAPQNGEFSTFWQEEEIFEMIGDDFYWKDWTHGDIYTYDTSEPVNSIGNGSTAKTCPNGYNPCIIIQNSSSAQHTLSEDGIFYGYGRSTGFITKLENKSYTTVMHSGIITNQTSTRPISVENSPNHLIIYSTDQNSTKGKLYLIDVTQAKSGTLGPCTALASPNPCLIFDENWAGEFEIITRAVFHQGKFIIENSSFTYGYGGTHEPVANFISNPNNYKSFAILDPTVDSDNGATNPALFGAGFFASIDGTRNSSKNEYRQNVYKGNYIYVLGDAGTFQLDITKPYDVTTPNTTGVSNPLFLGYDTTARGLGTGRYGRIEDVLRNRHVALVGDDLFFTSGLSHPSGTSAPGAKDALLKFDTTQAVNRPVEWNASTYCNQNSGNNPCIMMKYDNYTNQTNSSRNPNEGIPVISDFKALNGVLYFSYTDFYNDFYRETPGEGNQNSIYKGQTYNQVNGHELWKIEGGVLSAIDSSPGEQFVQLCFENITTQYRTMYYTGCGGVWNVYGAQAPYGPPDPFYPAYEEFGGPIADSDPNPFSDVVSFLLGNESETSFDFENRVLSPQRTYFEVIPKSTFPTRLSVFNNELWFFGNNQANRSERTKTLWKLD